MCVLFIHNAPLFTLYLLPPKCSFETGTKAPALYTSAILHLLQAVFNTFEISFVNSIESIDSVQTAIPPLGLNNGQLLNTKKQESNMASSSGQPSQSPGPSATGQAFREIAEEFDRHTQYWESSGAPQLLADVFEQDLSLFPNSTITKCVCLGLGNIAKHMTVPGTEHVASIKQLVVLQKLLILLRRKHSIAEVFFQDPKVTDVEAAFLKSLGYIIVEDPQAYNQVDENTLVFAPRFPNDLIVKCLGRAYPALYIGLDLDGAIEYVTQMNSNPNATPFIVDQLSRFRDAKSKTQMPILDNLRWCEDTFIYSTPEQERQDTPPTEEDIAQGSDRADSPPAEGKPRSKRGRVFDKVKGTVRKLSRFGSRRDGSDESDRRRQGSA